MGQVRSPTIFSENMGVYLSTFNCFSVTFVPISHLGTQYNLNTG